MGRPASTVDNLTSRQREVMDLVARGRTNGEIAGALGISLDGAKWHVSELLAKFNVVTREELVEAWESRPGPLARSARWLGALSLWHAKGAAVVGALAIGIVAIAATVLAFNLLDDDDQPATTDPTPVVSPTASPRPTSTPGPFTGEVPSTIQVIDTRTGVVTTIYEDVIERAWVGMGWPLGYTEPIESGLILLLVNGEELLFNLDGTPAPAPTDRLPLCEILIENRGIEARSCGPYASLNSDGQLWLAYQVENGEYTYPPDLTVPMFDQWALEVFSGERVLLQQGLIPCGGCDGRYGPEWSPSGRYLTFAESGGDARRFLADIVTGTTRQIGIGHDVGLQPNWSATGDQLIYPPFGHEQTTARFEDLETGEARDLNVPWPVQFDASGTLVYGPAWGGAPKDEAGETVIADLGTGSVLAALSGNVVNTLLWTGLPGVGRNDAGYVAVLQRSAACAGTVIYRESEASICIAAGQEGYLNGDASYVAVARLTGTTGRITSPGLEALEANVYAIDIVDTASGTITTVLEDVIGTSPPLMYWHDDGVHLLLSWPGTGIGL